LKIYPEWLIYYIILDEIWSCFTYDRLNGIDAHKSKVMRIETQSHGSRIVGLPETYRNKKMSKTNKKRKTVVSLRALFKIRKSLFFIRHSFLRSRLSRKVKVIKSRQDITTDIRTCMHACPRSVRVVKYCNIAILLIIKRHPNHQSYSRHFLLFFFS